MLLRNTGHNLIPGHRQKLQAGRGIRNNDDTKIQLVPFQLFTNGHRAFLIKVNIQMRIEMLEAGENLWEQIGTNHRRNTDFDSSLLQLLVIINLQNSIINTAESQLYAIKKNMSLRSKG